MFKTYTCVLFLLLQDGHKNVQVISESVLQFDSQNNGQKDLLFNMKYVKLKWFDLFFIGTMFISDILTPLKSSLMHSSLFSFFFSFFYSPLLFFFFFFFKFHLVDLVIYAYKEVKPGTILLSTHLIAEQLNVM